MFCEITKKKHAIAFEFYSMVYNTEKNDKFSVFLMTIFKSVNLNAHVTDVTYGGHTFNIFFLESSLYLFYCMCLKLQTTQHSSIRQCESCVSALSPCAADNRRAAHGRPLPGTQLRYTASHQHGELHTEAITITLNICRL